MGHIRRAARRARPSGARDPARWTAALAGFREPIVVILLLIAFFTTISGRPVNGLLLLIAAISLAWDAARNRRRMAVPPHAEAAVGAAPTGQAQGEPHPGPLVPGRARALVVLAGIAAGAIYAAVVGSFIRYSWPATTGVIGLATAVVAIGWRGPLRPRRDPGRLPVPGTALWAGLLAAAGSWELAALFLQPSLTTTSYAHPTISGLTDPLLASHAGRSVALAIWVAIGWFLAQR
jgi:hypothetical protein